MGPVHNHQHAEPHQNDEILGEDYFNDENSAPKIKKGFFQMSKKKLQQIIDKSTQKATIKAEKAAQRAVEKAKTKRAREMERFRKQIDRYSMDQMDRYDYHYDGGYNL